MKYIMFETNEGKQYPILFPDQLTHIVMNDPLVYAIHKSTKEYSRPVAAGFVSLGLDLEANGESESMNLKSRPCDSAYIALGSAVNLMPSYMVNDLLLKARSRK